MSHTYIETIIKASQQLGEEDWAKLVPRMVLQIFIFLDQKYQTF